MTDRELFKQALEALEINNQAWKQLADSGDAGFWEAEEQPFYGTSVKAITALRERLAQPEQEPVRVMGFNCVCGRRMEVSAEQGVVPTPPRREWVGLTKEEAKEISLANRPYVVDMIAALEARLKEKNNG